MPRGFFSNLLPILDAVRGSGLRTILLAHSFQASHQYYRRSPGVRADIVSVMA